MSPEATDELANTVRINLCRNRQRKRKSNQRKASYRKKMGLWSRTARALWCIMACLLSQARPLLLFLSLMPERVIQASSQLCLNIWTHLPHGRRRACLCFTRILAFPGLGHFPRPGEDMEAPCLLPIPGPGPLSHLAVREFYPLIINP